MNEPLSRILVEHAEAEGGLPQATLIGDGRKVSPLQAALVNGAISHALDFDDVQERMHGQPGRRIKLHFIPPYCTHLNPIERLWGVMHKHVTHNKPYATCAQFADATLGFLRQKVPRNWSRFRDSITDNFRVINPKDFRVVT